MTLLDTAGDGVTATSADGEYEDEEVIVTAVPETRRPVRSVRADSASRAADLATSVNRVVRDEKPTQVDRPVREEQPVHVERPVRPETRPTREPATRAERPARPTREPVVRVERPVRQEARPTRDRSVRPTRDRSARPRRSVDSLDDEVSHQVHKAKTKQSNALLAFLIIAVAGMGIFDLSNHALMQAYSTRTGETISDMRESIQGMNEDITQNNRMNDFVSSYKTTKDFVK